jgi:hypothetical protein
MKAQDEREKKAGEKCGVSWEYHGCDWPEWVADELFAAKAAYKNLLKDYQSLKREATQ